MRRHIQHRIPKSGRGGARSKVAAYSVCVGLLVFCAPNVASAEQAAQQASLYGNMMAIQAMSAAQNTSDPGAKSALENQAMMGLMSSMMNSANAAAQSKGDSKSQSIRDASKPKIDTDAMKVPQLSTFDAKNIPKAPPEDIVDLSGTETKGIAGAENKAVNQISTGDLDTSQITKLSSDVQVGIALGNSTDINTVKLPVGIPPKQKTFVDNNGNANVASQGTVLDKIKSLPDASASSDPLAVSTDGPLPTGSYSSTDVGTGTGHPPAASSRPTGGGTLDPTAPADPRQSHLNSLLRHGSGKRGSLRPPSSVRRTSATKDSPTTALVGK